MPELKHQEVNPLFWLFNPFTSAKAIFMLILLGFLVFANSMGNSFVADDITYILRNPDIHQLNMVKLFGPNAFTSGEYYRPLSAVFFAAFYAISGSNTFLFHFFQVVLHILTALLFFFFLKKFFSDKLSFFLSAVFLVHPVQVESVAYISGLTNILLLFFGLCALLITAKKTLHKRDYFLLIGSLFLALLAKETAILFIALLLIYTRFFN
ncbi:MAG: glycosyltransferase family 39 protein, partial [Patescibacteria group bacterium]|nr:glycosyltransferase family 39 protein [Patescibacteria group bacterium]